MNPTTALVSSTAHFKLCVNILHQMMTTIKQNYPLKSDLLLSVISITIPCTQFDSSSHLKESSSVQETLLHLRGLPWNQRI